MNKPKCLLNHMGKTEKIATIIKKKCHNVEKIKKRHKQLINSIDTEHTVKQPQVTEKKPQGQQPAQQKLRIDEMLHKSW